MLLHAALISVFLIIWLVESEVDEEDEQPQVEPEYTEVLLDDDFDENDPLFFDDAFDEPLEEEEDQEEEDEELSVREEGEDREDEEEKPDEEEEDEEDEDEEGEEELEEEEPSDDVDDIQDLPLELYAVEQITDGEEPDEADHISDEAHRADEETIAEVTTVEDVEEQFDPEALEQEADTELEMAMHIPDVLEPPDRIDEEWLEEPDPREEALDEDEEEEEEERAEEIAQEEEVSRQEEQAHLEYRDPSELIINDDERGETEPMEEVERQQQDALFGVDGDEFYDMDEVDGGDRFVEPGAPTEGGRSLLANWKENEEAMRASLENFLPHIEPGNHTSVNARQADHASYIAGMHRTIHVKWAMEFLPRLASNYPNRHRLNDMSLSTVVEIVIDAETGEVVETGRIQPSGHTLFDAEALNMTRNLPPQPNPPESIISPDGKVYIHWTFWRDQRQCGTFGVRIYRLNEDGEQIRTGEAG